MFDRFFFSTWIEERAPEAGRGGRPPWVESDEEEADVGEREERGAALGSLLGRIVRGGQAVEEEKSRVVEEVEALLARGQTPIRLGIVCDYLDEGWPSMDLAAEMLLEALETFAAPEFRVTLLRPPMPRVARRLSGGKLAKNADRYLGRYLAYPQWLRGHVGRFDLFHVVDHSYAHLVHELPAGRTVVTCHDLDAYRSVLEPEDEPRPRWFRETMGSVLTGLQAAAHVVCDSASVRDQLLGRGILPAHRVSTVPLPVHPDFAPDPDPIADPEAAKLLGPKSDDTVDLLHVGMNVPRKRIDFLLHVFAEVRRAHPRTRLVRAGGPLTPPQREQARELGVLDAVVELPFLERPVLAAVYRRAVVVLAPSGREGFGLPLVEALACGTPVVASDLPVFREVGGEAVVYRDPLNAAAWVDAVDELLWDRRDRRQWRGRREAALERAAEFGLEAYARGMVAVYRRVLGRGEE
ncbi:MAG TPA: glycosyltransferase family 1 protein [Longimicrobium sp.]